LVASLRNNLSDLTHSPPFRDSLMLSQGLAIIWWAVSLWFQSLNLIPVWHDQRSTFTQLSAHLGDPYLVSGFVNPPWTGILLAPFGWLPLPLATLVQLCLYFAILTGVIFKFGGNRQTMLIALTSFVALDAALELNIDWLVCLGLLVPPAFSGPFLLIKPQNALGYWLSFKRRELVHTLLVVLVLLVISLLLWGFWPLQMLEAIRTNTLGRSYNLAPLALLPWPIAVAIGLSLSWVAFRRHDPVLSILAWLFFIPYITLYALLLPLALFAIRYPRVALLISVVAWLVYGGVLARYFLHF
jgi:hypothetical protein